MIFADIRAQIDEGEGPLAAFAPHAADKAGLAALVCGFLNTRGGVVFVGVDADGSILGVPSANIMRAELETYLQNAITPTALFTLSVDVEGDVSIITIEAPQGRDKPYVVDGKIWVRSGRRTLPATSDALRELAQVRSVEAARWERRPSVGLEDEDLVEREIRATVEDARSSDRYAFTGEEDTFTVLRQLGMVVSGGLTQACDVVFAAKPAMRHPQCRVRFVQYASDKTGAAFLDNQVFEGPLVQVFNRLFDKVGAHVRIQARFGGDGHGREDRPNYSQDALREGLVNALAHRDYASFSGGVAVSVYPDRIEIWNSGQLPAGLKVADLLRPHPSIPTNPDIAHVLYLRRLMERIGRGTQKILAACTELGAPAPSWKVASTGVTLTIFAADAPRKASQPKPTLAKPIGAAATATALNERQGATLAQLRPGDSIRLPEYMDQHGVSERQARRDLAGLTERGFLVRKGKGPATDYQRSDKTI
ncbi:transcriptional regulator [Caulobacter zeae]|uniref:Transcriptional regulator n=1 Tax=Caulobacter zeae TaxID=2055137 RepID=A0A2N5DQ54_9CAUL|nr:ATP-binding protein [Caulobacter zeae]PLR28193.1 transcriptional regulator [Caulobacter zeae]